MKSHGTGLPPWEFKEKGVGIIFETGVLVFHPESISLGDEVYLGHYSIIKGYHHNAMVIGSRTWIGQQCFLHSAGGLEIGSDVGVGPGARILTSLHAINRSKELPIIHRPIKFSPVVIGDGCDIGANAVILPGVTLKRNVQVGAGAVVTRSFGEGVVIKGIPARIQKR